MDTDLFRGELVRLVAVESDDVVQAFSRWSRNAEYQRLGGGQPAMPHSAKATRRWIEENVDLVKVDSFAFAIRTLADDRLIGEIELDGVRWSHRESFVGIGIGDSEAWGKGYGTDAMCIILRFAFEELNLHRVALDVFEYNPRAIRSYEKAGFKHEGRMRGFLNRDGRRWDLIFMGILQEEWRTKNDRIGA